MLLVPTTYVTRSRNICYSFTQHMLLAPTIYATRFHDLLTRSHMYVCMYVCMYAYCPGLYLNAYIFNNFVDSQRARYIRLVLV